LPLKYPSDFPPDPLNNYTVLKFSSRIEHPYLWYPQLHLQHHPFQRPAEKHRGIRIGEIAFSSKLIMLICNDPAFAIATYSLTDRQAFVEVFRKKDFCPDKISPV